jgi:hypothetical protein
VDFEAQLVGALSEINKERREKKSLEEELIRIKEGSREGRKVVINLKYHLDKAKLIEETLKDQLKEKQCLEDEIVSQRKEAEKREIFLTIHLKEIYEDLKKLQEEFSK